jgi:hypothetical protein
VQLEETDEGIFEEESEDDVHESYMFPFDETYTDVEDEDGAELPTGSLSSEIPILEESLPEGTCDIDKTDEPNKTGYNKR